DRQAEAVEDVPPVARLVGRNRDEFSLLEDRLVLPREPGIVPGIDVDEEPPFRAVGVGLRDDELEFLLADVVGRDLVGGPEARLDLVDVAELRRRLEGDVARPGLEGRLLRVLRGEPRGEDPGDQHTFTTPGITSRSPRTPR